MKYELCSNSNIITSNNIRKKKIIDIGICSDIGSREYQQDCYQLAGIDEKKENGIMAVLCDGMGGLQMGQIASKLCCEEFCSKFEEENGSLDIPDFLKKQIVVSDNKVSKLKVSSGENINAGTTVVCAVINGSKLYISNVGDSRAYIIRDANIIYQTIDHNYRKELIKLYKHNQIPYESIEENKDKDALTSYIGIGGIKEYFISENGVDLCDNDTVLLCSDGLYNSLSEDEVLNTIFKYDMDMQRAAKELVNNACAKGNKYQDNTTVILLKLII